MLIRKKSTREQSCTQETAGAPEKKSVRKTTGASGKRSARQKKITAPAGKGKKSLMSTRLVWKRRRRRMTHAASLLNLWIRLINVRDQRTIYRNR